MNVLIIGGSTFVGPHLVSALQAGGHAITMFNRGRSAQRPPTGIELVIGDRATDIARLGDRRFDAVIDTCGYVPRVVAMSVAALAPRTSLYAFVSTISVYVDPLSPPRDETSTTASLADPTVEAITAETYGPLKRLCEGEVERRMAGRALVVRPGLIVGPLDPTDRFTYWPHRAALGGDMLCPGDPSHNISFIDVRDLAGFIVSAVERGVTGTFNAAGDTKATTMGELIDACVLAAGKAARPVWVDEAFLKANDVTPWAELPAWLPDGEDSLMWASSAKAVSAGLTYRPLGDTVAATLQFTRAKGLDRGLKAGLARDREAALLAAWHPQPK